MQYTKHTNKKQFCLSGLIVVCYVLLTFIEGFNHVQAEQGITSFSIAEKHASTSLTSFKTPSTVHRSLSNNKSSGHFSLSNKHTAKPVLKKYASALLSSLQFYFAKISVSSNNVNYSKVIARPGYYLFLFRYALF